MEEEKNKRIIIVSVLLGFLAAFPFMAAAFPYEKTIVHIPLDARIDRQLTASPFGPTAFFVRVGTACLRPRPRSGAFDTCNAIRFH